MLLQLNFLRQRSSRIVLTALTMLIATLLCNPASFAQQPLAQPGKGSPFWQYSGTPLSRVYADVQWGVQAVRHSDLNFFPYFGSATLGLWVFDNIGIETFGDLGLASHKSGAFTLEVEEASGVGVRFQSPSKRGLSIYLVAGYVDFAIVQIENDARGRRRVSQGFGGLRMGIGLAQRLRAFDSVLVTGEYRNYYSDDEIQLDSVSIGLRVNVR